MIAGEQQPKNPTNAQRKTVPGIEPPDVIGDGEADVALVLYLQHILNIANIEGLRGPAHPR